MNSLNSGTTIFFVTDSVESAEFYDTKIPKIPAFNLSMNLITHRRSFSRFSRSSGGKSSSLILTWLGIRALSSFLVESRGSDLMKLGGKPPGRPRKRSALTLMKTSKHPADLYVHNKYPKIY